MISLKRLFDRIFFRNRRGQVSGLSSTRAEIPRLPPISSPEQLARPMGADITDRMMAVGWPFPQAVGNPLKGVERDSLLDSAEPVAKSVVKPVAQPVSPSAAPLGHQSVVPLINNQQAPASARIPLPVPEPQRPAPAYQILFSDGRLIRIDPREGPVIYQIGRSLPEHLPEGVHPMPVDDGTGLISRSHFLLGYSREGVLWVQDLHSSNGTRIVDTLTEERWKVPSESRVRVKPSQRVEFGHSSLTISLEEEPL